MLQRLLGPILTLVGALLLLASLLADAIGGLPFAAGLGVGRDPGFGGQQVAGALIGVAMLAAGIWLWSRPGAGQSLTARFFLAVVAVAAVIGGAVSMVGESGRQPWVQVESCVQAAPVPGSEEGNYRVTHHIRLTNPGKATLYVDSLVLEAFRDTAQIWLPQVASVDMDSVVQWKLIHTMVARSARTGAAALPSGGELRRSRTYVLSADPEPAPYKFRAYVYLRHRTWRPIQASTADWIQNFPARC